MQNNEFNKNAVEKIKELKKLKGMDNQKFSEFIEVKFETFKSWLKDENTEGFRKINVDGIYKIVEKCEIPFDELLGYKSYLEKKYTAEEFLVLLLKIKNAFSFDITIDAKNNETKATLTTENKYLIRLFEDLKNVQNEEIGIKKIQQSYNDNIFEIYDKQLMTKDDIDLYDKHKNYIIEGLKKKKEEQEKKNAYFNYELEKEHLEDKADKKFGKLDIKITITELDL